MPSKKKKIVTSEFTLFGPASLTIAGRASGRGHREGREVLTNLEQGEFTEAGVPKLALSKKGKLTWETHQRILLQSLPDPLREALRRVDPNRLTPLEALNLLNEMKARLYENE